MGYELFLNSVAEKRRDIDVAEVLGAELRALERRDRPALDLLLGLGLGLAAKAGGDDGDLDLALHGVVADDAENDVGARVGRGAHDLGRLLHLLQGDVLAGGDVEQDALGAVDRRFEQRAGDSLLRGVLRAGVAGAMSDAHQGLAGLLRDFLGVCEVEVDGAWLRDQIGDALDALPEYVVGHPEGILERRLGAGDLREPVVRDDDQGVDLAAQSLDPLFGGVIADAALESERPRHHADGESARLLRHLGDDGRRTGACTAAHARGAEYHVGFLNPPGELGAALVGPFASALTASPCTESPVVLLAHLSFSSTLP